MEGKSFFLNLNMKIAILKVTRSNSLIIFNDLNIGLECSSNFENVIITHNLFLRNIEGLKGTWMSVSPSYDTID